MSVRIWHGPGCFSFRVSLKFGVWSWLELEQTTVGLCSWQSARRLSSVSLALDSHRTTLYWSLHSTWVSCASSQRGRHLIGWLKTFWVSSPASKAEDFYEPALELGAISITVYWSKQSQSREFPGDPVVRTLHFQCRRLRFDPWSGN